MVSVLKVNTNIVSPYARKTPASNQKSAQNFCAKQTVAQKSREDLNDSKIYLLPALVVLGGAAIAIASQGRGLSKATEVLSEGAEALKPHFEKFSKDTNYRKSIVSAMNLPESEAGKLRSIIGSEELTSLVKEFAQTPQVYSPGKKSYTPAGKVFFEALENIESCDFGANLHMHTINSDGRINIASLLSQAAEYGDKRFAKKGKPFVLAITDHDSVNGCREAIDIIRANPEKYKNIRLVLGIENTTTVQHPALNKTGQIHLLSYGINPYSKEMDAFLYSRVQRNHEALKKSIGLTNKKYSEELQKRGFEYSFEDFTSFVPSVIGGVKPANYLLKDYMQFKIIHNAIYSNNPALKQFFGAQNITMKKIPLNVPVGLIPKKPDYSGGKQYYDYYYDALKTTIIKENPTVDSQKLSGLMPPLSDDTRKLLNGLESDILNPQSPAFVPAPEFLPFETAVSQLSKMEGVSLGIAHPGVILPKDAISGQEKLPEIYEPIYKIFKETGKDKAVFSEDYYQIYYSSADKGVLAKIREFAAQHKLLPTGSLDTHTDKIYGTTVKTN